MKKGLLIVLFVVLCLSTTQTTSANSGPPIIGINIEPSNCVEEYTDEDFIYDFPGNFDILVKESDFEKDMLGEMTMLYQSFYPFYQEIAYLDNLENGWTSFSAFYQGEDHFGYSDYYCAMRFGDAKLVNQLSSIKVVYFDDAGETLFISEEIEVPSVFFFQERDAVIYFDTDALEITPSMDPYVSAYLFLTMILIGVFIAYSVVIEIVMALLFKLSTKKALLNILLINFVTQVLMYLYFIVLFDGFRSDYYTHLYIIEGVIILVEFGYLYWRLKPTFGWKHLAVYVVVSNLVSYFLGLLRY